MDPVLDWLSQDDIGLCGVESMALDPSNPARLYLLAGTSCFSGGKTAILRSQDYGATFEAVEVSSLWRAHGNGMGRQTGEELAVDPQNPASIQGCPNDSEVACRRQWHAAAGRFPKATLLSGLATLNL